MLGSGSQVDIVSARNAPGAEMEPSGKPFV